MLPRVGGYVVAAWLLTIVANLLIKAEYYDVALRDFGLALGALSLARLATGFRGLRGEREHPQQSAGRRRRSGADHGPPGGVEVVGANGDQPQGGDWASKERPARGRERRR